MEVGELYLSRLADSSGRTYRVERIYTSPFTFRDTVKMADIESSLTITYTKAQFDEWIGSGLLTLVGKSLIV